MAVSIGIPTITQEQIQALIDASLATNGIPDINGTPNPLTESQIWRDTSQTPVKLMTYKDGVVREVDVIGNTEFQDLSGNTITID